ncbi:hypothetical protein KR222_004507, partial [Zaprionus bogoriensis]
MDPATAELMLNQHSTVQQDALISPHLHLNNNSFFIDVLTRVYRLKKLKNIVLFVSERLKLNNPQGGEFFDMFWRDFEYLPRIFWRRDHNYSTAIMRQISTPAMVLIMTTERDDPIMEVAAGSMTSMRWMKTIFLLIPRLKPDDTLRGMVKNLLKWSWTRQFSNSFLITIGNNLFLVNPYPKFKIQNKTRHWSTPDLFKASSSLINTMGYDIRTPVLTDIPRVFKGADGKSIYGTSARFFLGFLDFINATMTDTSASLSYDYFDLSNMLDLMTQGVYETLIHSFTDLDGNHTVGLSYPLGINDLCVVVPYRNQSTQDRYVREALQQNVWMLLLLAAIYISLGIWLCSPRRPRDLSSAMLQCVCSITNNAPIGILKAPTLRMRYIYMLLFFFGVNCSNMYISKMASYLTSTPSPRQISTLEDIIEADLRILVQRYEYDCIDRSAQNFPRRFMQQFQLIGSESIKDQRDQMNSSYGYLVPSDRWSFIHMRQKHLHRPLFHLTSICSGPYYHVFPMHIDSHLRSAHQNYILISMQAGLNGYWSQQVFWDVLHFRRFQFFVPGEEPSPLSMSFLSSMVRAWCFGLVLAGIAFCFEMKWHLYLIAK